VSSETLADHVESAKAPADFYIETLNIEDKEVVIGIKVSN
jgi:hypothetical protein